MYKPIEHQVETGRMRDVLFNLQDAGCSFKFDFYYAFIRNRSGRYVGYVDFSTNVIATKSKSLERMLMPAFLH